MHAGIESIPTPVGFRAPSDSVNPLSKAEALETNLYNALPVALLALVFGSFLPTPVRLGPWLNRVVVVLWMETGRRPVVETAGRQVGGNLESLVIPGLKKHIQKEGWGGWGGWLGWVGWVVGMGGVGGMGGDGWVSLRGLCLPSEHVGQDP